VNRVFVRNLVNKALQPLHLRVVHSAWGPRGFAASFLKLAKLGVRPKHILDVGAATGTWTEECLTVFPSASYVLVDPLPENQLPLAALAQRHANVTFLITALGAEVGSLPLRIHGDQSSFLPSEYDDPALVRETPVATIDSLIAAGTIPAPGLIKADVQGFELEVLKGATASLHQVEFVLLEVSFRAVYAGCPLAHEVIAAMGDYGFRIYDICSHAQRPRDGELFQADILFARRESAVFEHEGYF
jgi:FkbM family methyltransferase